MGAVVARPIYDAAKELIEWLYKDRNVAIRGAFLRYNTDSTLRWTLFHYVLTMTEARHWEAELLRLDQKYGIEALRSDMGVVATVAREMLEGREVKVTGGGT